MCACLIFIALVLCFAALGVCVTCPAGTYFWEQNGLQHCQKCFPGCACPGNFTTCIGCSGGFYAPGSGASACTPCPAGTTSDWIFNVGCEPYNVQTPCANNYGPLGWTTCHPIPPPQEIAFVMPTEAAPIPLLYDIDGEPMLQQSY